MSDYWCLKHWMSKAWPKPPCQSLILPERESICPMVQGPKQGWTKVSYQLGGVSCWLSLNIKQWSTISCVWQYPLILPMISACRKLDTWTPRNVPIADIPILTIDWHKVDLSVKPVPSLSMQIIMLEGWLLKKGFIKLRLTLWRKKESKTTMRLSKKHQKESSVGMECSELPPKGENAHGEEQCDLASQDHVQVFSLKWETLPIQNVR